MPLTPDGVRSLKWKTLFRWSTVLIVLIILGHFWGQEIPRLERWLAHLGPWGPAAFIVIFCAVAPLGFSITALAIAAGALFGLIEGFLILVIAAFIAECLMFFLSRHFFKEEVERYLLRHPKLSALNKAATNQGVKFQILLRLMPIPYAACCYLLSLSGTRFVTYMLGFAGFIPGNFVFVYMGYMAKHVTRSAHGVGVYTHYQLALLFLGLLVALLLFAYLARLAHRAFSRISINHQEAAL